MDKKSLVAGLLCALLSLSANANSDTLQKLPKGVDLSSAEISAEYLRSELGEDFVSDVFGEKVACNTQNNAISAFGEKVEFDNNPRNRFILKTLDFSEVKTSYVGDRTNIGQINSVIIDPVLSAGNYRQRSAEYGEYCRQFEQPNLVQHINANTILASWIYSNQEIL